MIKTKQGVFWLVSLLSISFSSYSQVSDSLFDLSCQHENIVILNEDMEVLISGRKTYLMTATVIKDLKFVIKNTDGLKEMNPITLPQEFDELFIHHAPAIRNTDWSYDLVDILKFEAKKNAGLASSENVDIKIVQREERVLNTEGFFGKIFESDYYLENIAVGDTIHLSCVYDIPFKENWLKLLSNLLFFHGKYPKKTYNLKWCYHKDLEVDSVFQNHENPGLSIEDNNFCYEWSFKNLPGCLDEPCSRPYKELPYFVFTPKSYDFEYEHFNSFKLEFIPPYFLQAAKRESELYVEYWDNVIGNKSKNNLRYQRIVDRISRMAGDDTTGLQKMRYFQQFMVDSVSYEPAIGYYKHNEDHLKQKGGVDLYGRRVRDHNIDRVYGNVIGKFGLNTYTAYPVDSRMGEIGPFYTATVKDNDLLFAVVLKNVTFGLVIPKSDKNHYYFEEFPFYYEGIPVLLIHYTDYPNELEKRNFNTKYREISTPVSNWKDNYRKTQSQVTINIDNNQAWFKTRVILSGQYSTLTRAVYDDKPIDSTINPQYFKPVWDISPTVNVSKLEPAHPSIFYPFKTSIALEYSVDDIFNKKGDAYTLNPGRWVHLIQGGHMTGKPRLLDYYPDFIGCDTYTYMIEFDKKINIDEQNKTASVKNDFAHLGYTVKQIDSHKILITCRYSVQSRMIAADDIANVEQIQKAINEIAGKELIIRVTE